jgi:murein tripeptide amidase MpaA
VLYSWSDAPNQSTKPEQNFLNPAFDGVRGLNDLTKYGEFIAKDDEVRLIALGSTIVFAHPG